MVSALTLLETDETPAGRSRWSYVLLVETTLRRISERPADDARELFRRTVFNALVSNTDDLPRPCRDAADRGRTVSDRYVRGSMPARCVRADAKTADRREPVPRTEA